MPAASSAAKGTRSRAACTAWAFRWVNALSTRVEVNVRRDGSEYRIAFDHGKTCEKLERTGDAKGTGTKTTFWPDPEIFTETTIFDYDTLANRFREMAF